MKYIVSTDLDGTLLDHHSYDWRAASEAINLCSERQVPIVFNTSKTLREVSQLQSIVGVDGPMVVENGSAMILPKRFSNLTLDFDVLERINLDGLILNDSEQSIEIIFGEPRTKLLTFIKQTRQQKQWLFEGFDDWPVEKIAEQTGLSYDQSVLASDKHYSEPFKWNDSEDSLLAFKQRASKLGFKVLQGGRFYHLQGNTTKALPILWLQQHILPLYGANCDSDPINYGKSQLELICLGDSQNDVEMLNVADYPVCVRSPVSNFPELTTNKAIIFTEGEGPVGWNESVKNIILR